MVYLEISGRKKRVVGIIDEAVLFILRKQKLHKSFINGTK